MEEFWDDELHGGLPAKGGVVAAKLAERGFTAHPRIIEEKQGYADTFTRSADYHLEKILSDLGTRLDILASGVGFKRFASCARTHPAMDAMLELVTRNNIRPEDVERITCGGSYTTPQILPYSRPQTALEGKFSMEFCLAIILLEQKGGLSQFTDEKVQDPKVQEIIKRITFYVRPDLQTIESSAIPSSTVSIVMKDGRELVRQVDEAKGSPFHPLARDDLRNKYRECATLTQSEKEVERAIEMVENLETVKDISALTRLLSSVSIRWLGKSQK